MLLDTWGTCMSITYRYTMPVARFKNNLRYDCSANQCRFMPFDPLSLNLLIGELSCKYACHPSHTKLCNIQYFKGVYDYVTSWDLHFSNAYYGSIYLLGCVIIGEIWKDSNKDSFFLFANQGKKKGFIFFLTCG